MQALIKKLEKIYRKPISEFTKRKWINISVNQKLSEDFIRKYQDKVDWYWISRCQILSEDFIREFQHKVYWPYISQYQKVSKEFIKEFQDMIKKIPHWEFQYIHGREDFPNSEVRDFYGFFKKEFLKGNPIDVGEYSNYYFFLLFDLIKNKVANLETHLKRLMESYPKTIMYCEYEMAKLGMTCRTFNGDDYINISEAGVCHDIYVVKDNFENKKEIIQWIQSDEFSNNGCSAYINSHGIINVINNQESFGNAKRGIKIMVINEQLPEYIQFGVVEGNVNFTNCGWSSEKNRTSGYQGGAIEPHKIKSLRGCPQIVKGDFIAENIGIDSLIGGPLRVEGDFIVKRNEIKSFEGMPQYIGGLFNISNNELTDDAWDYAKDNIDGDFDDYNIKGNKFVKYRKELKLN